MERTSDDGHDGDPAMPPGGDAVASLTADRTRLRELTERQQRTLEALRVSEERFRALADSAGVPIVTIDEFDVIRFANPATGATFGYDAEALVGRHLTDLMPERYRERHLRGIARFLQTGKRNVPWRGVHLSGLHSSGSEIPLWVSFGTFEHRGERHFTGIMLDLSERIAAEQALRASEAHYRRLVTTSPYAVYVLDLDGRFRETNPAAEAILERGTDDVLGVHFSEVLAPEAREELVDIFRRLVQGDLERYETETAVVRPSGEQRIVRIAATRIDVDGSPAGVHGMASDITEERARDAQRRMLAAALDNLPDAVAVATLEGRYLYRNAAHADLLRYAPETMPRTVHQLLPDEEAAAQLEDILMELRVSGRWAGRARRLCGDGSVLDVSLLAAIVPLDPAFLFIVMRDASDDIAREEHVRRVERLASIGTLVGGVAHELNNPLTAIVGFSNLMASAEHSEDDLEMLRTIAREAERAARIVADLRRLARNTQERRPREDAVDLNDIVRHVLKVRAYSLSTRNIEVVERQSETLPRVRGDRTEIEQVVLNLIVNAEQALERIDDRPRRLVVRTQVSPTGVALTVMDNGPGIPRDVLHRIFDPFFTTKVSGEGTGLGLSLAHGIVEEHGGDMRVFSDPGNGAQFIVELPAYDRPDDIVDGERRRADIASARLRVLIVDDEPAVRALIARLLTARGHEVAQAADGAAALEILGRDADFDVIVSDMRMPGIDGIALLGRLREREPRLLQRVILATGDPTSVDAHNADVAATAGILLKPFDAADLVRLVEEVGAVSPDG